MVLQNDTYSSHVIREVDITVPFEIRKWIRQPDHIHVIVHHIISQLQNMQQMPRPAGRKIEETLSYMI